MTSVRPQVYLFLTAVPLHLVWEVAQIAAYEFPPSSIAADIFGCLVPSLGDGLMMLMIYWAGWGIFRSPKWILSPGAKGYAVMMALGLILAVTVELNALFRTSAWAYSDKMMTIPLLGVGILPILQMVLLPPVTVLLLQRVWNKRN